MAISFVGAATGTGNTLAVPGSHQAGDVILLYLFANGDATPTPSLAEDFTDIITGYGSGGGADVGARSQWRYATSSSDTITGLDATNFDRALVIVLRGAHPSAPIGSVDNNNTSSGSPTSTINYGPLTLDAAGTSYVVAFSGQSAAGGAPSTPSGMTVGDTGTTYGSFYIGPTSTFTSKSSTISTAQKWVAHAIEVLAAVTTIDGTLTKTLADATVASAATVKITGSLSQSLAGSTAISSGTVKISGSATPTLADATVSAGADTPTTGIANFTLEGASTASEGAVAITGSLAKTLEASVVDGAASVGITGAAAFTLADAIMQSAGTQPITGAFSATLADVTVSSTEAIGAVEGNLEATLADATVVSAGTVPIVGTGAVSLAAATLGAATEVDITAILVRTLGGATLVSAGTIPVVGSLARTLSDVGATSAAAISIVGAAEFDLDPIEVESYEVEPEGGFILPYPSIQISLSLSLGL